MLSFTMRSNFVSCYQIKNSFIYNIHKLLHACLMVIVKQKPVAVTQKIKEKEYKQIAKESHQTMRAREERDKLQNCQKTINKMQ